MSRITELVDCVKIYNLCNHCNHYKSGMCSADDVNCKEEIEKQIVSEIQADALDKLVDKIKETDDYEFAMFSLGFIEETVEKLKESKNG